VILGILAAFAVPRFVNLGSDARIATVNGALGAVRSAASVAHSTALAKNDTDDITMEGVAIAMANQYPTAAATGIVAAAQLSGEFTTTGGGAAALVIQVNSATDPATCSFSYTAAAANAAPTITAATTGGC